MHGAEGGEEYTTSLIEASLRLSGTGGTHSAVSPSCSWDIDPALLFTAPIVKKESSPGAHICQHLRQVRA